MSKNIVETIKQEQKYKMLIRNLRKQQEDKNSEKANDKKTDNCSNKDFIVVSSDIFSFPTNSSYPTVTTNTYKCRKGHFLM